MARATRMALDLALVSVSKLRPSVSKLWGATKSVIEKTAARPLVCNFVVEKLESALFKLASSRAIKPVIGTAWQYAKVEMVPPMTLSFFNGAPGKKLEETVAKSVDGFITGLDRKIRDLDQAELREKEEKEAAIKAAQEKAKAKAKAKELARKKEEEEKRKKAEKEAKAKAEAKAAEEAKKEKPKDPPKTAKKAAKRKPPAKK